MKMCDINPHIRLASEVYYKSKHKPVFARDCRMFYILSGKGEIIIENKRYNFVPNSFFYCCAESTYSIESEHGMKLIVINFDLDQSRNSRTKLFSLIDASHGIMKKERIEKVENSNFLDKHFYWQKAKNLYTQLSEIVEEFASQKVYFREKCAGKLKDIITGLHRDDFHNPENTTEAIGNIIEYIHNNIQKKIENSELAEIAGYHEYHVNRVFIKHTGMSMHRYILVQRMNEAKRLILNTDMLLSEIAESVGFGNNAYFSYYFKKEFSVSPSAYRKKFKNII